MQDAKYSEVKQATPPVFFRPYRQDQRLGFITFYVRALGPEQLMPSINSAIARLDPNLPVENLKTLDQQVRENVFLDRMISTLSARSPLATVLAAVGLYGVLAYTVAQRTREIGVRMALGADGGRVRGMVLRQVALMMVIGGALGLAGAIALGSCGRVAAVPESSPGGPPAGGLVVGSLPSSRAKRTGMIRCPPPKRYEIHRSHHTNKRETKNFPIP